VPCFLQCICICKVVSLYADAPKFFEGYKNCEGGEGGLALLTLHQSANEGQPRRAAASYESNVLLMANPNQISVCIYVDLSSPPKFCI